MDVSNCAKFRFGKVTSKYLIADIFAYSGDQARCLKNLYRMSKKLRRLIVENLGLLRGIVINEDPMFLDARENY
jgi:hypothetical protein